MTLHAYGYHARSDGLGNTQARLLHRHQGGTQTERCADVPTDSSALLGRLTRGGVR
jgi:hypothetical protein